MTSPKKLMKYSLIFSIISCLANLLVFASDIWLNAETFDIVYDVISFAFSVIATIGFSVFSSKPISFATTHFKWYIFVVVCASICSIILAIFAIMSVNALRNYNYAYKQKSKDTTIEAEGRVIPTAEEIMAKLKTAQEMRDKGEITQEEYEKLKEKILSELTK